MKTAIITTTIHVPKLLEDYVKNVLKYRHDCFFVVVGDKKTPGEAKSYCCKISQKYKVEINYLDVDDQKIYLNKFPLLDDHIPYNCTSRRNIAMLFAYRKGADVIITIDDDNFLLKGDFIKEHSVGLHKNMEVFSSDTKWLNPCDYLAEKHNRPFYHRGFPLEFRFLNEKITTKTKEIKIIVNAGFWLEDPDIDAITRLYYLNSPIESIKLKRKENFALELGTWSPFNSQNSAIAREVIPAYFLSPVTLRYEDIWASYVVVRIAEHLGHYISFGNPLVTQRRNQHNYWDDWDKEVMCMRLTYIFTDALRNIQLSKNNYKDCFKEISQKLKPMIEKLKIVDSEKKIFKIYLKGMNVWVKTFRDLD